MVCLIGAIGLRVAVTDVRSADGEPSKSKDTFTSFEARAEHVIDGVARHGVNHGFWGGGKYGAYPAMAQFAVGHIDRGRRFAERQLTGSGAMFREFGTMALYAAYHEKYGSELRQKVKENQLESDFFNEDREGRDALGGASENHKLMYAAAGYLAGIMWPEDYPRQWFEISREALRIWFEEEVTRIGFWEQDSPTYLIHHLGPIVTVAEHAPEGSLMKRMATMTLEWYLASIAGEYLHGYWITASARDYVPVHGVALSEETAALTWLCFGDSRGRIPHPHPTDDHPPFLHWLGTLHFAISDYRPPRIIQRIATDREEPYVHREFMVRNPMKPREYNYITPAYGVAAIVEEGDNIPPDMTRWKVQWVRDSSQEEPSVFLMKHPKPDEEGWRQWEGASPYEEVLAHKGTLVAVYNIPSKDEHPFIDGPFAEDAYEQTMRREGWWFFHTGSMLMAVKAINGLQLTEKRRSSYDHYGKTAKVGVLRSEGRKNGLVVETSLASQYEGETAELQLDHFAHAVLKMDRLDASGLSGGKPTLKYITLSGEKLAIQFDGYKKINGDDISSKEWLLLENPWMRQEVRGRYLKLRHGRERRVYDFKRWKVRTGKNAPRDGR